MTNVFSINPSALELTGLVRSIWCYQAHSEHAYEQVLPGISSQLLINLHQNELRHWVKPGHKLRTIGPVGAQGILTAPVIIDTVQKRNLCGVEFTSFGLSAFCDIDASRFTDTIVDASEFWGPSVTDLRATLLEHADPAKRCKTIEKFLAQRLTLQRVENNLIEKILDLMSAGINITDIRKNTGLSQRRLHTLFLKRIGVHPKIFARVKRFEGVLGSLSKTKELTDLAFDLGFSDQSHFTREFRVFAGKAPTQHKPIKNECRHTHHRVDNLFKTARIK